METINKHREKLARRRSVQLEMSTKQRTWRLSSSEFNDGETRRRNTRFTLGSKYRLDEIGKTPDPGESENKKVTLLGTRRKGRGSNMERAV